MNSPLNVGRFDRNGLNDFQLREDVRLRRLKTDEARWHSRLTSDSGVETAKFINVLTRNISPDELIQRDRDTMFGCRLVSNFGKVATLADELDIQLQNPTRVSELIGEGYKDVSEALYTARLISSHRSKEDMLASVRHPYTLKSMAILAQSIEGSMRFDINHGGVSAKEDPETGTLVLETPRPIMSNQYIDRMNKGCPYATRAARLTEETQRAFPVFNDFTKYCGEFAVMWDQQVQSSQKKT